MYFDQRGNARACCQNSGTLLGSVTNSSIREAWENASANRLRTALESDDYSEGCGFCGWQLAEGNEAILFARDYDRLVPENARPRWPRRMEFALSNTCNLQCVMCNGEWSSAIRGQREGLAPLPKVYGERFFEELVEFLPHLDHAQFAGGEPFLGAEALRVMEMLCDLEQPPKTTIITNGTQLTPRVRRILERLQPRLMVSIDGATPETYDAIRVGSHLPDVLDNLDEFVATLGPDQVMITTCLMSDNWHEFHDVLALAEVRGLDVGVNVVRMPAKHSPYRVSSDKLTAIVNAMKATEVVLTGPRLQAWEGHLAALAHRAKVTAAGEPSRQLPGVALEPGPTSRWAWLPFPEHNTEPGPEAPPSDDRPEARLGVDLAGRVSIERLDQGFLVDVADLDGQSVAELTDRMTSVFGDPKEWELLPRLIPEDNDRLAQHIPGGNLASHEIVQLARRDEAGRLTGCEVIIRAARARTERQWD